MAPSRNGGSLVAFVVTLGVVVVVHGWVGATYVGSTLFALLVVKLWFADRGRARARVGPRPRRPSVSVAAVMPIHNEDPVLAAAAIESLLSQTVPVDEIQVVDDGSTDGGAAADAVVGVLRRHASPPAWRMTRLEANRGKRAALATGFRQAATADIYLCMDSDTCLEPRAVECGLVPFSDPGVTAVTGLVTALNWRSNLLTRLIDLRYLSAFLSERAAYSYFGAVLCCCGSLSFYRAHVIHANLDDFESQRFLGQDATFGDDRRLTNYALRAGRVVLADESRASTAVPERMGHYLRQQVRWNKSFIRESLWVLGTFPLSHPAFWLTLLEAIGWTVVGMLSLTGAIVIGMTEHPSALATVLVVSALAAYARSTACLGATRPEISRRDRLLTFALAPLYGVMHLVFLVPIRVIALATLRRTSWGTRMGVEVRLRASAG